MAYSENISSLQSDIRGLEL